MNASTFFESLCDRIRAEYIAGQHTMSWSFLYTRQSTLHPSQSLVFLGLNPGGREGAEEVPSFEEGNAYLDQDWDVGPGKAPLQRQVQELFKAIAVSIDETIDHRTLMCKSLAGNYVPFRSPNWHSLPNKKAVLDFAQTLWSDILTVTQPSAIISMAEPVHRGIQGILRSQNFQSVGLEERKPVGWGKVTYSLAEFSDGRRTVVLVRLPHLSQYKIFSRPACRSQIKKITERIAGVIDPTTILGTAG